MSSPRCTCRSSARSAPQRRGAARAPRLLTAILLLASASVAARGQEPPPAAHADAVPPSLLERSELGGSVDLDIAIHANHSASDANVYPGYGSSARRAVELAVGLAGFDLALPPEPGGFHLVAGARLARPATWYGPELALGLAGRHDRSDARVFPTDGDELARTQRLLVAAAIPTF